MEALKTKELLYYLLFTEGDEKLAKDQENFKRELELSEKTYSELKMSALSTRNLSLTLIAMKKALKQETMKC